MINIDFSQSRRPSTLSYGEGSSTFSHKWNSLVVQPGGDYKAAHAFGTCREYMLDIFISEFMERNLSSVGVYAPYGLSSNFDKGYNLYYEYSFWQPTSGEAYAEECIRKFPLFQDFERRMGWKESSADTTNMKNGIAYFLNPNWSKTSVGLTLGSFFLKMLPHIDDKTKLIEEILLTDKLPEEIRDEANEYAYISVCQRVLVNLDGVSKFMKLLAEGTLLAKNFLGIPEEHVEWVKKHQDCGYLRSYGFVSLLSQHFLETLDRRDILWDGRPSTWHGKIITKDCLFPNLMLKYGFPYIFRQTNPAPSIY